MHDADMLFHYPLIREPVPRNGATTALTCTQIRPVGTCMYSVHLLLVQAETFRRREGLASGRAALYYLAGERV